MTTPAPVDISPEAVEHAAHDCLRDELPGCAAKLRALRAALTARDELLRDADTVIEDWTELLRDGGYRSSIIDGDVVRDRIRAILAKGETK